MHVYVDVSGDCGFTFAENSSRYFVVTALIVADPVTLRGLVDGFKTRYRTSASRELKFPSTPARMREELFVPSVRLSFVSQPSLLKTRLASQLDATAFYREYVRMVIASASDMISNGRLVIDESVKDKRWQGAMKAFLRQEINGANPGCIGDIRFTDASRESVLQATDMLCGAVRSTVESNDDRYLCSSVYVLLQHATD